MYWIWNPGICFLDRPSNIPKSKFVNVAGFLRIDLIIKQQKFLTHNSLYKRDVLQIEIRRFHTAFLIMFLWSRALGSTQSLDDKHGTIYTWNYDNRWLDILTCLSCVLFELRSWDRIGFSHRDYPPLAISIRKVWQKILGRSCFCNKR